MKIRSAIAVGVVTFGAIALTAVPAAALDAHCGMVITDRGAVVTLTSDLNCGTAPGLTIAADDVTLDLGGHTLKGTTDSSYGIRVVGPLKRPTITHGTIIGFGTAIDIQKAYELTLKGIRVKNPGEDGIDIADSAYLTMDDLALDGTGFAGIYAEYSAIKIERSHDMDIAHVAENHSSGSGITVRYSHDYTIHDSSFFGNGGNNIAVERDTTAAVVSNVTTGDSVTCVVATNIPDPGTTAPTVTFDHVVATDCSGEYGGGAAFYVNYSSNVVLDSVESHGGDYGVMILSDDHNVVLRNSTIDGASATGVVVQGFSYDIPRDVSVLGTTVDGSVGDGYFFRNAYVSTRGNSATNNGRDGFRWSLAAVGTSDTDTATTNHGNGILVDNGSYGPIVVTGAESTRNTADGLQVSSGLASVTGGGFLHNGRQGLYAVGGILNISSANASYNAHSGVFYSAGTGGHMDGTRMVKNHVYGRAVVSGASFADRGGNAYYANGVADRCTGTCTV